VPADKTALKAFELAFWMAPVSKSMQATWVVSTAGRSPEECHSRNTAFDS
jgi:hypothetical protein